MPRPKIFLWPLMLALFCGIAVHAQQDPAPQTASKDAPKVSLPVHKEQMVVTGTYQPVAISDVNRDVTVIELRGVRELYPSLVDALRSDPAIDLQERGPNGVQADLSIRGSSFGQTLVLVNGLRMNDVQTGHHNLDLPMPFQSIDHIEVLHGSGSTMYGADALGGVVNFITAPPVGTELRLGSGFGNFGINQQYGVASFVAKQWTEQLSFGRDFSTGFIPDRDYRALTGSSETHLQTHLGATMLLLAGGDKPFGANQFYSSTPAWERTKSWFAGASQELGPNTLAAFGYRRHTDIFELFRDDPAVYTNNHITDDWQLAIRRHDRLNKKIDLFYGVEGFRDTIDSTNLSAAGVTPALGQHARNRGAIYANFDWRPVQRLSFSVGAREEGYSGPNGVFTPTFAAGYRLSERFRLRASAGRAFRLPTYTDLYYEQPAAPGSPGFQGNPNLKPETAWSYDGGLDWTLSRRVSGTVTVFYRNENNDLDYLLIPDSTAPNTPLALIPRTCTSLNVAGCVFQAANLQTLSFTGFEASVRWEVTDKNRVVFAYTGLHGAQQALNGLVSLYVFNYPVNTGSMQWQSRLPGAIEMRTRVAITERYQNDAYALWDLAFSRRVGHLRPYLQMANLGNTSYAERPDVLMPGRTIIGGIELVLTREDLAKKNTSKE